MHGNEDDSLLFLHDEEEQSSAEHTDGHWTLLIVDDDQEIHSVTKLALSGVIVAGKTLQFAHAYSGADALEYLRNNDDIAMVLLDVVMETDDAGLRVVKAIRDELKNEEIRIILRTGQPGYAPEESVVKQYDINDYKTKTELTRSRLMTTVFSAVRSYQQIRTINENRRGLRKIIHSAANLMERHSIINFSEGVVTQIASLLGLRAEGIVGARVHKRSQSDKPDKDIIVLGAAGHYADAINNPLAQVKDKRVIDAVTRCLTERQHIILDHATVFFIDCAEHEAAAFIETKEPLRAFDQELVEVFLANIAIGFENANLFEDLRTAAYLDQLTGQPNRAEFIRMLDKLALNSSSDMVAAIIDIDHFSDVNDGLGQDVGNELLVSVARRLRAQLSSDVFVSRLGADVYGVIGGEEQINPQHLESLFLLPFKASEQYIPLNVTCGFTRKHDTDSGLDLLKYAYIALKNAKNSSLQSFDYYHPSMEEETLRRLDLVSRLRSDFAERKLEVWFQPQVELETGRIIGAEALLRWPQADGSFISPAVFIPLAEYSGLIVEIGAWVLEEACKEVQQFDALGLPELRVAVNVSVPQFRTKDFPERLDATLKRYNVAPDRIELEITESIVMEDPELVADILRRLKSTGMQVAIDDFGVGFSSLSYIQKLPLDRLKIDRSFVQNACTDSGRIIIETIVNMAHRLGLSVLAEGIETEDQARYFKHLKCGEAQGYLFARPMPAKELKALLKQ